MVLFTGEVGLKIELQSVKKAYGKTVAVSDVNLTIESGALHFFLGPSGCGKTTMLRMIAGLESVTSGKILFDGRDVTDSAAADRGIGMVFQNYALWPHMTVRKNIEYGLRLRNLSDGEVNARVEDVLKLTQLAQYVDRYPGQLSGGQQQRVALARAMAIRPNVLLLDEPLSNLDAKLRLEMRDNISRIHAQTKITTIYVTHDQKEALSMATNISVMRSGHMIQTDPPRKIYHHPNTPFIAGFIGETNHLPGKFVGVEGGVAKVETKAGILTCRAPESFKPSKGDDVHVSVRPEAIHVSFVNRAPASGTLNKLKGKISHLTYLGDHEQVFMDVAGVNLKASVFNAPEHHAGDGHDVEVTIPAQDLMVLPFENDLQSGT